MPTLTEDKATELAETFHLIGDPNRLRIVFACLDEPVCVSDMAAQLGLSPSLVSHHLRLLRAARLLGAERRGKQVSPSIRQPTSTFAQFSETCMSTSTNL